MNAVAVFSCICIVFIIISPEKCLVASQGAYEGEMNYYCNSVGDCRNFGYVCKERSCQCDKSYIPDQDKKKCLGGVNQKCLYDEHCIAGAYCQNQSICKCKQETSQPLDNGLVCAGAISTSQISFLVLLYAGILHIICKLYSVKLSF